jgi:hypothetical protein
MVPSSTRRWEAIAHEIYEVMDCDEGGPRLAGASIPLRIGVVATTFIHFGCVSSGNAPLNLVKIYMYTVPVVLP